VREGPRPSRTGRLLEVDRGPTSTDLIAGRALYRSAVPIKIAHVTATDYSLIYLLRNQLVANRAAGYEVIGVARRDRSPDRGLAAIGVRHCDVPITRSITPLADLAAIWQLVAVFRRERPTIVHTHTIKAGLLGQIAAKLARVPLRVHTIHGLYFPLRPGAATPRRAFVWLERATHAFTHHSFSQNPEDVPVAIREQICAPDRIETIGNGIDLARFDPARISPIRRAEVRAALGFSPDHIVVGAVGRLVVEKGYLDLFTAAARIKRDRSALRFVFVGPFEPEKSDAISPAALVQFGIADTARFLGHRTDVDELYAAMDIFVLPSHREGFPRAAMEASAMGLPCVVTNIRGCRQTVDHEITGLVIPRSDPLALANAILRLAGDAGERQRLGTAARAKAVAEFDERVVFARVLAGYERLLAGQRPARTQPASDPPSHALTVDLEDWHQIYRRMATGRLGPASESVVRCTHRILDRLDEAGARATFFVVGTVADEQPALIRAIAKRGHEIASHSHLHRPLRKLSPAELAADLARSKHRLESITGDAVLGFRAPEFSIESLHHPVFELLARLGFAYDSSVVPGPGMRYAIAGAPDAPFLLETPSGPLFEFPISTLRVLGMRVPLGGSALRFVGIHRLEREFRRREAAGASATLYVHPYEFSDERLSPDRIGLQDLGRARWLLLHNFRTPKIAARIAVLLQRFQFRTLRERLQRYELANGYPHDAG